MSELEMGFVAATGETHEMKIHIPTVEDDILARYGKVAPVGGVLPNFPFGDRPWFLVALPLEKYEELAQRALSGNEDAQWMLVSEFVSDHQHFIKVIAAPVPERFGWEKPDA